MFKFSKVSQEKLTAVDPKLRVLMETALSLSKIDFGITEGFRTVEKQQEAYRNGKSQLDGITKKSKHQLGLAVDLVCYDPKTKKPTYEQKYYYYLAGLIQQLAQALGYEVTWGGWWSFEDCCHWEIKT